MAHENYGLATLERINGGHTWELKKLPAIAGVDAEEMAEARALQFGLTLAFKKL
jgi:hypothetical protein